MEDASASASAAVSTLEDIVVSPAMAAERVEKSPYDMLKESKTCVEEIVAKMLSLKRDDDAKPELRELVTQMFLHFVSLRQVLFSPLFIIYSLTSRVCFNVFMVDLYSFCGLVDFLYVFFARSPIYSLRWIVLRKC